MHSGLNANSYQLSIEIERQTEIETDKMILSWRFRAEHMFFKAINHDFGENFEMI